MRFTQVKIRTGDPERLAEFYVEALDCEVILPLTTLDDPASLGVGAQGADVRILVLSLPGPEEGPTLELISMGETTRGQGLLTFHVDDVDTAARRVVDAGGSYRGEVVEIVGPSGKRSRFVFMSDPEGNVIDLLARVAG